MRAWDRFLCDLPPSLSEPATLVLRWQQNKYADLGAVKCAVSAVDLPSLPVQLAAMRLLVALLEGGNGHVQASIQEIACS